MRPPDIPDPSDPPSSPGGSTGVSTEPDWNAPERWATMRDFGVTRWLFLGLSSLVLTAAGVAIGWGATSVGEWLATVALATVGLALLLATALWTPAMLTRQGVAADAHAITLVADPMWWFPGRRARIPWSAIRKVRTKTTGDPWFDAKAPLRHRSRRQSRRPRSHYVDLWLRHSATRYHTPIWASISSRDRLRHRRDRSKPPKRLHIETTWIGGKRIMVMLWSVRPDFFADAGGPASDRD